VRPHLANDGFEIGVIFAICDQHCWMPVAWNGSRQAVKSSVVDALHCDIDLELAPGATTISHGGIGAYALKHGITVAEGAVGEIILDRDTQGGSLDPQIDIFSHQNDRGIGMLGT